MSFSPISDFGEEPQLSYPTPWNYRVIGREEAHMRAALAQVLSDRAHTIRPGNQSRGGRYCSLDVELTVQSDGDRRELFGRLRAHSAFVYIL